MAYLAWNSAFETGIAGIDYEHQQLVKILNHIHDLIAGGPDPDAILEALADFHTLASAHFALEEKIMQDQRYPGLAERHRIHRQLLDRVSEIMDGYEAGDQEPDENLPAMLRDWLFEAMDVDVKLFADINDTGLRRWGLQRR